MTTWAIIGALIVIGHIMLIFGATGDHPERMRVVVLINIFMVARFAPLLCTLPFGVTNFTNVSFAIAVCAQLIILERHGEQAFQSVIPLVYAVMGSLFIMSSILSLASPVPGNEAVAGALKIMSFRAPVVIAGSFAAFALSMHFGLLRTWQWMRTRYGPVPSAIVANIACQTVDTPVFFGIAFYDTMTGPQLVQAVLAAWIFKVALVIVFIPVIWWLDRHHHASLSSSL